MIKRTSDHASAAENNDLWDRDGSGTIYFSYRVNGGTLYHGTTAGMTSLNGLSWASGNVGVDPVFTDRDGTDNNITTVLDNDWHLNSGSPFSVTTGGLNLSASFAQDKEGSDRTSSWSIGAYEFDPF